LNQQLHQEEFQLTIREPQEQSSKSRNVHALVLHQVEYAPHCDSRKINKWYCYFTLKNFNLCYFYETCIKLIWAMKRLKVNELHKNIIPPIHRMTWGSNLLARRCEIHWGLRLLMTNRCIPIFVTQLLSIKRYRSAKKTPKHTIALVILGYVRVFR
jgi:hypothetical protein